MRNLYKVIALVSTMLITLQSIAQVNVTSTSGTSPVTYTTLKLAFDAVNAGTHTGVITIGISANTTETASAVLYASGTGSSSYSRILITPEGGATRTITGAVSGHLIDLNGALNVTINGLNTAGNALTISNTATGAVSTIRFINDASYDTVTNCTVLGSSSTLTYGTFFFSTGTVTGNNNNAISNCNIGPAGTSLPINSIYSAGLSDVIPNSNTTITGNNIYDFFSASNKSNGIFLETKTSGWTITNNKIYQTATRTYTTGNAHIGIYSLNNGNGFTITGNTIGYASSGGTGVYTMAGSVASTFIGISVGGIGTGTTTIQGNTITAIKITTTGTTATGPGVPVSARWNARAIASEAWSGSFTSITALVTSASILE